MMNENERLYSQYEDAVFALIMNRVAEENGRALIQKNEELLVDPSAAVPEVLSKRCMRAIERNYRKTRFQKNAQKMVRVLNHVALWILIPIFMFVGVFATSETVRVKTLNLLIEEFDIATEFRTQNGEYTDMELEKDLLEKDMLEILNEVIPSDFSLMTSSTNTTFENYVFHDDKEAEICITRYYLETANGAISVDTENATVWHESMGMYDVMFSQKDNIHQAVWTDDVLQQMYIIEATNVPFEIISNVVNGIIHINGK